MPSLNALEFSTATSLVWNAFWNSKILITKHLIGGSNQYCKICVLKLAIFILRETISVVHRKYTFQTLLVEGIIFQPEL